MFFNEGFKISVDVGTGRRPAQQLSVTTLEGVIAWIESRDYPPVVEKKLKAIASSYPHHALPFFKKNINRLVEQIRASVGPAVFAEHKKQEQPEAAPDLGSEEDF